MTFKRVFLPEDIIRVLNDTPASAAVVAKRIGCSLFTSKKLLNDLYLVDQVERVEIELTDGISYLWKNKHEQTHSK